MTNLEALQIVGDSKNAYSLKWCEALFQLRKMIEKVNKLDNLDKDIKDSENYIKYLKYRINSLYGINGVKEYKPKDVNSYFPRPRVEFYKKPVKE